MEDGRTTVYGSRAAFIDSVIWEVHASLPEEATLREVRRALREAYPFGPRKYGPYKTWCRRQRRYLTARFGRYTQPGPKRLTDAQKLEAVGQMRLFDPDNFEI